MKKVFFGIIILFSILLFFSPLKKPCPLDKKLQALGYNPEEMNFSPEFKKTLINENIPKTFLDAISSYQVYNQENLINYYNYYQQGYSLTLCLNKTHYPDFLNPSDISPQPALQEDGIILVNRKYMLNAKWIPAALEAISLVPQIKRPNEIIHLEKSAYRAYSLMINSMHVFNLEPIVYSGYRSFDKQTSLWTNNTSDPFYLAKPGHSEHQTGLAIDIATLASGLSIHFEHTEEFNFLVKYAHEFGFILRYPKSKEHITGYAYEPWHYRYLGTKHAKIIYEENLCLEEYLYQYYPLS